MDVLRNAQAERFCESIVLFLRQQFPSDAKLKSGDLQDWVARSVQRAQKYGLETERQALTFILAAWILGDQFDHDARVRAALTGPGRPAQNKMEWLRGWMRVMLTMQEKPACGG